MATLRPSMVNLSRICTQARPFVGADSSRALFNVVFKSSLMTGVKKRPKIFPNAAKYAAKKKAVAAKKRKLRSTYIQYNLKDAEQFSLCDAMRYLRAAEVGYSPTSTKYEIAVKLKSPKNGPIVRNRLRLPVATKTDLKICVICPPDSAYAASAKAAGAYLVGEDEIFQAVKDGKIDFDRCVCQVDSLVKMNQAGLARILGPKGLMPNAKTRTLVKNPSKAVRELTGGSEYRERVGVIRMAVGQLGFTPLELQRNIKVFMQSIKKDMAEMSDKITKEVAEVVLSSTHGPGFSLNGNFLSANSTTTPADLPPIKS